MINKRWALVAIINADFVLKYTNIFETQIIIEHLDLNLHRYFWSKYWIVLYILNFYALS